MATPHPFHGDPDVLEVSVPVATVWTGPEAPRDVDAAAVANLPDVAGWAASMDAQVRKGLNGRTLTQLLMGEAVRVLDERGEWVQVAALGQQSSQHGDGYPGWVRRAHLAEPAPPTDGADAFVMSRSAVCDVDDGSRYELSFGTALRVEQRESGAVRVLLPGGRTGRVAGSDVRLSDPSDKAAQPAFAVDDILTAARQFLGMRYLWGGTSSWGLDCSGLVHLTYRAHGVLVPRDAYDQADDVVPVPLGEVRPGDLYFFARPGERIYHVGFVTRRVSPDGTRWMLHAPESGELIEDAPMAPHRVETLVSAGRVRPAAG
ncbi:MAG TPA: C40 family peptidase [Nocardioidaceae bacterium]|nr:C40 family peptidase [Nocardioidaceae bacterium]